MLKSSRWSWPALASLWLVLSCAEPHRAATGPVRQPELRPSATAEAPEPEAVPLPRCTQASQSHRPWAFSRDGQLFAAGHPGHVEVFDTKTWSRRLDVRVSDFVESIRLSDDGRWLFLWSWPPPDVAPALLSVIDLSTGAELGRREAGEHDIEKGFVAAPDGSWVALSATPRGAEYSRVEWIQLPGFAIETFGTGEPLVDVPRPKWTPRTLPAGSGTPNDPPNWDADKDVEEPLRVKAIQATSDSRWLVIEWALYAGVRTSVVDAQRGRLAATLLGYQPTVSPDSRWLVLARPSGVRTFWELGRARGATFYDPLCPQVEGASPPSFSPDSSRVDLSGRSNCCLVEMKAAKLQTLIPTTLPRSESADHCAPGPWTSDGKAFLVALGPRGIVELAVAASGQLTPVPGAPTATFDPSNPPAFFRRARDSSLFWVNARGYPALEWQGAALGWREFAPNEPDAPFARVEVSQDGEHYVRLGERPMAVYSTRDSTKLGTLVEEGLELQGFDPTGRWAVTSAKNHELTAWEVKQSRARLRISGCLGEDEDE